MTDQPLDNNMQGRINSMFSSQELPAYTSLSEVTSMKARIQELEKELNEQKNPVRKANPNTELQNQRDDKNHSKSVDAEKTNKARNKDFWLNFLRSEEDDDPQYAKILQNILGVVFVTDIIVLIPVSGIFGSSPQPSTLAILIILGALTAFASILVRRKILLPAKIMIPMALVFAITYIASNANGLHDSAVPAFALAIIIGSLIFGEKGLFLTAIMSMAGVIYLGYTDLSGINTGSMAEKTGIDDVLVILALLLGSSGLLRILMKRLNASIELTRANEKEQIVTNTELRILQKSLEERVVARTRDLELASEVGRIFTARVDNLPVLLKEAVELIRVRFNLYYTQVYLLDPSGRTLTLRAGTGEAGQQLLKRGHNLLITSSSLNSRSVSERQTIVVSNTRGSADFLANPLLPKTASEMTIPLIASNRVVGVLDMQSDEVNALNEENRPAFEALAGQLAIAIQNAALFDDAEQSRLEVERQIKQQSHINWLGFLNAIERDEKIGYIYSQNELLPFVNEFEETDQRNMIHTPITVAGLEIGGIRVSDDPNRKWTSTEAAVINETATQLSRHIETLRLLAQSDKYRVEAEQISKSLTREGWNEYLKTRSIIEEGFIYDNNKVQVLSTTRLAEAKTTQSYPIYVRDELIGNLAVDPQGAEASDVNEIISVVAQQLSSHIENLRLIEETEQQRSQLYDALTIAKLAYWQFEPTTGIFNFSDNFYLVLHTTTQEQGGHEMAAETYLSRFVHPQDAAIVVTEIERVLASPQRTYSTQVEYRILYADGGIGNMTVNVFVEKDENGKVLYCGGTNQDITDRKQGEVALAKRAEQLLSLNRVMEVSNSSQDLQFILQTATDEFRKLMQAFSAGVLMLDEKGENLTLTTESYADPNMPSLAGRSMPIASNPATDKSIKSGDTVLVPNAQTDPILAPIHAVMKQRNIQSVLVTPLFSRNKVIGVFSVDTNDPNRQFDTEDMTLIETLAKQLASSIENLRLIEETQQRTLDLEESQTFLDSVVENLPTMLFVKDAEDLRFVRFNKAAEELTGFRRESLLSKNDHDFFSKEEADLFTSNDRQVLISGQILDIPEEQLSTAHQGTRYLHTRKVPIYGKDGKAKYLLGVSEDITERKHDQEILARRANQLGTVASLSTTASTVLDPEELLQAIVDLTRERFDLYHAHIYLNNEALGTLQLASGAGEIGRQMVASGHSIALDAERSLVARAARQRRAVIINDVRNEPGFLPNVLLPETRAEMAIPIIVGDNFLGVFDIQSSNIDGFSEEDASIYATLSAQVAVALQNARLYMEQAATVTQLRELDRLKSSFLANMSHELRTPLNSILGFTDVMLEELDGPLTPNMDNDLKLIQKNGKHLLHLINDVLDMAKIESGKMNLIIEKFNLNETIEDVMSLTSSLANEKAIVLSLETESDQNVFIRADHTRLRQVLINLVNNGIKFTEKGGVSVRVTHKGNDVLIAVRDTGLGIPVDHLDSIFQEFTQVDSTTTRKAGGTGLGLPISRRLIEMHGGKLWAESSGQNGNGTTFNVLLPIEATVAEAVESEPFEKK